MIQLLNMNPLSSYPHWSLVLQIKDCQDRLFDFELYGLKTIIIIIVIIKVIKNSHKKGSHLLTVHYVSGTMISTLYTLSHVFTVILWDRKY